MFEAERWSSTTGATASSCGDSGKGGTGGGSSPEASRVFLFPIVTVRLFFGGVLVDIMDYEVWLRVVNVVLVLSLIHI